MVIIIAAEQFFSNRYVRLVGDMFRPSRKSREGRPKPGAVGFWMLGVLTIMWAGYGDVWGWGVLWWRWWMVRDG